SSMRWRCLVSGPWCSAVWDIEKWVDYADPWQLLSRVSGDLCRFRENDTSLARGETPGKLPAELVEVRRVAEDHDRIAGRQDLIAGGGEFQASIGPLDRDDDHAGAAFDVGIAQAVAGQRTGCLDRQLVHLDGQAGALGDQLGELDSRR